MVPTSGTGGDGNERPANILPRPRQPAAGRATSRRSSAQWARDGETAAEPVSVDVLIPTCDRPAELAVTLAGLAAQGNPVFRVVISDQSQNVPAWQHPAAAAMIRVLRAQGREVISLRHLPRRGMAEHRQFLLEQSHADKALFLDDDVWLEPGALECMSAALDQLRCGFVGMAPQGLSYLDEKRPEQTRHFEAWNGPVRPERVRPKSPGFGRWALHSAANLSHVSAELGLLPDEWLPYRVAWLGGCVMYRREALQAAGGFTFWERLPPEHSGEDVLAQWFVMEKFGAAGILPAGAVHLESPTTLPDRRVEAHERILGANPLAANRKERTLKNRSENETTGKEEVKMTETPNPIQIQTFLGGVDYPADREALLSRAKASGADATVLKALESLPERQYDSPTAVSSAIADAGS